MLYNHVTLLMLRVVEVVSKTTVQQSPHMKFSVVPGDIQIGALFPQHEQKTEGCGKIWEQYGIQRTEIALKTVRDLNKQLPFKLGITIRDSCWTERVAMEQAIMFLRGRVTQQQSCCAQQATGCDEEANPVVAVVGPAKSSTTIAVQNLLQVFHIPQIGYGATTPDLSDKEQFGYFMRVVPSDAWQANAIFAILQRYRWRYVAVIYSAGNYGEKGYEELQKLQKETGYCFAYTRKVKSLADSAEFEEILTQISTVRQNKKLQVIICFCEGKAVHNFFVAQQNMRKKGKLRRYQWIGSDGWADRPDVVEGVEEEATGSFSIRIHSPYVKEFDPYYHALRPMVNKDNPWFGEYWESRFKCSLTVPRGKKKLPEDATSPSVTECSMDVNDTLVKEGYQQDAKLSQVANSIRVVAYALRNMFYDKCYDNKTLCEEMKSINGTILYKYMLNVTFVDQFNQELYFDRNGDPPAWYDILNYIGKHPNNSFPTVGSFRVQRGGIWDLSIEDEKVNFTEIEHYNETRRPLLIPVSVCSDECGIGQKKSTLHDCCWTCDNCTEQQIVNYTLNECQTCVPGTWPDLNQTTCEILEAEALYWLDAKVICAWILALMGMIVTTLTTLVFVRYNHTPVVKSTTRELSYIILSGIMACYAVTFIILARPTFISCFLTRVLPPIAFSIIYAALLTKTNRIARILAGSKKRILTKKPRFLSTSAQVVITWILVGVECLIVAVGVMEEMPQVGYVYKPRRMFVICASTTAAFLSPFLWDLFLITLCTLYAVKTRNLPENFNEAKFIGFTMYCTLVIWIAFIVLHFNSPNKALTMSFSFSVSATVALSVIFFPKLYIILLHPEKNVRSSYTTTKLIRCHFGNSQATDSKHVSISKAGTSQHSASSYQMRTASMRMSRTSSQDASTQTNSVSSPSRLARGFSMLRHRRTTNKPLDSEIIELIDCCRRYQDAKAQSSTSNFVIEESQGEDVINLLAGSIEESLKTVLSAVSRQSLSAVGRQNLLDPTTAGEDVAKPWTHCGRPE